MRFDRRLVLVLFSGASIATSWVVCQQSAIATGFQAAAPAVISLSIVAANRAAVVLRGLYPHAVIRIDGSANAVIVVATQDDVASMRAIVAAIDVKSPTAPGVEAIQLRATRAEELAPKLRRLFPSLRVLAGPNANLIVAGDPQTLAQAHAIVVALDTPVPSPTPRQSYPATAVSVSQGVPRLVARAAAHAFPNVAIAVSGESLLLRGTPDDVAQAKALITQLDEPPPGTRYTQIRRLTSIDADSVAALLSRSFSDAAFEVEKELNAIAVTATNHVQERVAEAIVALDVPPGSTAQNGSNQGFIGGVLSEVVPLRAAVPGANGAASTSAADIAQTVTQALGQTASDLHITVYPNSTKLILTGSEHSIELARGLIAKLDVAEPLVELDTEVLEVDESVQKQLGFKFPTPVLSTTYSEIAPTTSGIGTPQLGRLQALTRTPLSLQGELDFLISTNKARILEDPRITTFSGRTASLRAGETVNILTTAGGGSGTVATTQVQSFQTGVTLDITPVVNADDYVTVTLHPSVNSEAGVSAAGVPNIQTRDTTTTIGLHDGETIVVGGLIEDSDSRTIQKVPLLGDLPLIGRLFQDVGVNHTRNELIVTVTPHILRPGTAPVGFGPPPLAIPIPESLPTLEASATLPPLLPAAEAGWPQSRTTLRATQVPVNGPASSSPGGTPTPSPSPTGPAPVPSAFGQTNTFTYGAAPANNYASASQPPQIFFVQVQPTVVADGQSVTISAITTTNVSALAFGPTAATSQFSLPMVGPGKWQATFNFSSAALPSNSGNVNELLTATTSLGASTSMRVPFTLPAH